MWRQRSSVKPCTYTILHSDAQAFSCRNEKKNTFLSGGGLLNFNSLVCAHSLTENKHNQIQKHAQKPDSATKYRKHNAETKASRRQEDVVKMPWHTWDTISWRYWIQEYASGVMCLAVFPVFAAPHSILLCLCLCVYDLRLIKICCSFFTSSPHVFPLVAVSQGHCTFPYNCTKCCRHLQKLSPLQETKTNTVQCATWFEYGSMRSFVLNVSLKRAIQHSCQQLLPHSCAHTHTHSSHT